MSLIWWHLMILSLSKLCWDLGYIKSQRKGRQTYQEHRWWVIGPQSRWLLWSNTTRWRFGHSYLRRFIGSSSNVSSTNNFVRVLRSSRINGKRTSPTSDLMILRVLSKHKYQTSGTWSCETCYYTWGSSHYLNFVGILDTSSHHAKDVKLTENTVYG